MASPYDYPRPAQPTPEGAAPRVVFGRMPARPPSLRKHQTGQFFVRWGGKNHYLGVDAARAARLYVDQVQEWAAWRRSRAEPAHRRRSLTIDQLAEQMLETIGVETGEAAAAYYRKHLTRFRAAWGRVPCSAVRLPRVHPAVWLNALKADCQAAGLAPRTINHDLNAAKRLLTFGADLGQLPACSLRGARPMRLGERRRIDRPLAEVVAVIDASERVDPRLGAWMRLQFLGGLRPGEVVELVHGRGAWEAGGPVLERLDPWRVEFADGPRGLRGGVYRVKNKVAKATHDHRYLVLSPSALLWLSRCERCWSSSSAYAKAASRASPSGGGGVHYLRHSAASHLRTLGAALEDIRLALGHWPPGAWQSYVRESWSAQLSVMRRLDLPSPTPDLPGVRAASAPRSARPIRPDWSGSARAVRPRAAGCE